MLQAAEEEEERRNNRPNFAMSEDVTVPRGAPSAAPGGAKRVPLKELSRAESILSTQSTRRNYAYSLETAPDAHPTRKHLNTFSVSQPRLIHTNNFRTGIDGIAPGLSCTR